MRTDPTDTGGLFVGRRPGTAPTRYARAAGARRRGAGGASTRSLAHALLGLMVVLNLLFWGPIPAGALWIASQVQYRTDSVSWGILLGFAALLAALFCGLAVLKRLDRAWIVVRRAAGVDQRGGALGRVFGTTAIIGAVGFTAWLLLIGGPRPDARAAVRRLLRYYRQFEGLSEQEVNARLRERGGRAPARRRSRASSRSTCRARPGPSIRRRPSSTRSRTPRAAACTATSTRTPPRCAPSSPTASASRRSASSSAAGSPSSWARRRRRCSSPTTSS